jgi:hypothetical protein
MVAAFVLAVVVAGCLAEKDPTRLVSVDVTPRMASGGPVVTQVVGSGHLERDLGEGLELTTFSYSANGREDGSATGQYQYNFRALNVVIHGTVSCVTIKDNQGWVGGNITRVDSDDPADQELVGTEVWWRVIDNGQGNDVPDQTSSLLFAIPGSPITSASWCANQEARGVVRNVLHGNIQVN